MFQLLLLLLPQVLTRAYSKNGTALPAPIETHVTRWGKDPLAYGAYSYYATGNPKNITGETLCQCHTALGVAYPGRLLGPKNITGRHLSVADSPAPCQLDRSVLHRSFSG